MIIMAVLVLRIAQSRRMPGFLEGAILCFRHVLVTFTVSFLQVALSNGKGAGRREMNLSETLLRVACHILK